MSISEYQKINCDFYDHFEIFAMKKVWVKATMIDGTSEVLKIKEIQTRAQGEFLTTTQGKDIRLDQIAELEAVNYDISVRYFILNKLDYNLQSNKVLIKKIQDQNVDDELINKWMSHIINALAIWSSRIKGNSPAYGVWQIHKGSQWDQLNLNLYNVCIDIILQNDPLELITYKNTAGIIGQMTISQIMFHMINHSTYHRGQVAIRLTDLGYNAVATDYFKFQ